MSSSSWEAFEAAGYHSSDEPKSGGVTKTAQEEKQGSGQEVSIA